RSGTQGPAGVLFPTRAQPAAHVAVTRTGHGHGSAFGVGGGKRLHHSGQREIAVKRARGTVDQTQGTDRLRLQRSPVRIPFPVSVDREIHRHSVHHQQYVPRVIRGESAHHHVRREAWSLALFVHA